MLLLCWAVALALVLASSARLTAIESVTLIALLGFAIWTAASVAWAADPSQSVLDVQRRLVYGIGFLAVLLIVRRRLLHQLLGGVLVGITVISTYALSTRLFPSRGSVDTIAINRLAEPIGYWNGLAIFAVMGALLALGFAARGRGSVTRATAAAALPILSATLYFTYSRGGWMALGIGLVGAVALDTRRLQLVTMALVLAVPAVAAVWFASRSNALTAPNAPYQTIRHDGRILAVELVLLGLVSSAVAVGILVAERKIDMPRAVKVGYSALLVLGCAGLIVALVVKYNGPAEVVRKARHSFEAPPETIQTTGDLNARLFSLSSNGRLDQWRVAWHDYKAHRWLGSGSGSFESYWLEHRTIGLKVRDAHSLYLETLAELGPVGLALLMVAVGLPLVAGVRARRGLLIPAVFGAYVAFLAHAGVDWDWELVAVTLTALLLAGSLLIAARDEAVGFALGVPVRAALLALVLAIGAFSVVALLGNRALASSRSAVESARWYEAEHAARRAIRWAPWSAAAWQDLGNAQLGLGRRREAVVSLRKAARMSATDWSIWYDLSIASAGADRRRAFLRAQALNPLSPNIAVLRQRGYGRA